MTLSPMEPDFVNALGRTQAEAQIKKLFDYFGRPLDSEFKHDETGFKIHLDGHKSPMRKFYYAATTDQNAKGVCFFSVSVVPDRTGFTVTEYGPIEASIRRASGLVKIISLSRQQRGQRGGYSPSVISGYATSGEQSLFSESTRQTTS